MEYFHRFLGASLVAPGHTCVLPLPPEFIVPQDGADKQDSEHAAVKRIIRLIQKWLKAGIREDGS